MRELSNTELLTYSTIRIECENSSGQKSSGTGFSFKFLESSPQSFVPVIIKSEQILDLEKLHEI